MLDAGRDAEGHPFYVMRKIEGQPLANLIAAAPSVRERLALVPNVLAAVDATAYAHARGVIHRDIKPSNVLVGAFGETLLIDWGIARELAADDLPEPPRAAAAGLTRVGSAFGTPGFMAPEQARGEPLDRRADVYALGATLYHVLAGAPPLHGIDATQAIALAAAGTGPELASIPDEVPAALTAIVAKATAPAPEDRYADAGALAADLRRFLAGQLVGAHRYTARELFVRWLRRHRLAVGIGALATIAIATMAILSIRRVIDARDLAGIQRDRATAAGLAAAARADDFLVERAAALATTDPSYAIALLQQLSVESSAWSKAAAVVETAAAHGIARGDRSRAWAALAAAGDQVAVGAEDGTIALFDPALVRAPRLLGTIGEPVAHLAWLDGARELEAVGRSRARWRVPLAAGGPRKVEDPTPTAVPPVHPIGGGTVHRVSAIGGPLVYTSSTGVSTLLLDGVQSVTYDGDRVAASDGFEHVVEWELRGGALVERARWKLRASWIGRVGSELVADDDGLSVLWLTPGQEPRREPRLVLGGFSGSASTPDALYVAVHGGGVVEITTGHDVVPIGPREPVHDLAVVGDRLVALGSGGVLVSWDLRARGATRIHGPADEEIAGVDHGLALFGTEMKVALVSLATGATVFHADDAGRLCGDSFQIVSTKMIPGEFTGNVAILDPQTFARRLVVDDAEKAVCARDGRQIAIARPGRVDVFGIDDPTRVVASVDTPTPIAPSIMVLEGPWLVLVVEGRVTRHDLRTGTAVAIATTLADSVAIDPHGRVALITAKHLSLWEDGTLAAIDLRGEADTVVANPAGFVVTLEDATLVVLRGADLLSIQRGNAIAPPAIARTSPTAVLVDARKQVAVVDLETGLRRTFPWHAVDVLISPDGRDVLANGGMGRGGTAWRSPIPHDPAGLQRWLHDATNARITADATTVTWP